MKITALLSITTIAACFFASPASAQVSAYVEFPTRNFLGAPNATVPVNGTQIALGDAQETVEKNLGAPMTRLSADAWLLENVIITLSNGRRLQCKNVLLVFKDGKLSSASPVRDQKRARVIANARSQAINSVAISSAD